MLSFEKLYNLSESRLIMYRSYAVHMPLLIEHSVINFDACIHMKFSKRQFRHSMAISSRNASNG